MTELAARRGAVAHQDVATALNTVTDITCTKCRRSITVTLFELAWSKPCPMCRTCPECRELCLTGQVEHGMAGPGHG